MYAEIKASVGEDHVIAKASIEGHVMTYARQCCSLPCLT